MFSAWVGSTPMKSSGLSRKSRKTYEKPFKGDPDFRSTDFLEVQNYCNNLIVSLELLDGKILLENEVSILETNPLPSQEYLEL